MSNLKAGFWEYSLKDSSYACSKSMIEELRRKLLILETFGALVCSEINNLKPSYKKSG